MKIFETKVREYDVVEPLMYRRTISIRVWKLFGIVIWRRPEK